MTDTRAKTVVLVDDDDMIRAYLRPILREKGYEIVGECGTLVEAVRQIEDRQPGVVFLDIHLHGGNGLAALDTLKASSPQSRFIMLSGESTVANVKTAIQSGARDFLTKPFTADHVFHALERVEKA